MKRGRSKTPPSYRLHKRSGNAIVTIQGKMHYLGEYDSPESRQLYHQLIADLWNPPGATPKQQQPRPDEVVTVSKLAIEFAKYAVRKHGKDSQEWKYQIRPVLKKIRETYGHLDASEFGPIRFENYRQTLVQSGLSRQVIRRKAGYVIGMFANGVKYELIEEKLWSRLLSLGPVEMKSKPRKKRWGVDPEIVAATRAELTPVLADMVEVHRLIGARPSEVCNLRPYDIDRSGEIWIYTPASHKTEHLGKTRRITIGPKAQAILSRYLLRESKAFCFTPAEAYEQHYQRRREARQTPDNQGNKPGPRKQKSFRANYNQNSYRRAIERAALRAFPIPEEIRTNVKKVEAWKAKYVWKPNQLRKSAATAARKEMDLETAQLVLGHASKRTTEKYYAEMDNERAIEFAKKFG